MKEILPSIGIVILFIFFLSFLLTGCDNGNNGQPVSVQTYTSQPTDFGVTKLFTHSGCDIYRFYDHGYNRYYVTCNGQTNTNHDYHCGKSICSYPDNIQTYNKDNNK